MNQSPVVLRRLKKESENNQKQSGKIMSPDADDKFFYEHQGDMILDSSPELADKHKQRTIKPDHILAKEQKLAQMKKVMDNEKIDIMRKLPLNLVRTSSLLKRDSVTNELRKSVKQRILINEDITHAKGRHASSAAGQIRQKVKLSLIKMESVFNKGEKFFGYKKTSSATGHQQKEPTKPVLFKLATMERADEREKTSPLKFKRNNSQQEFDRKGGSSRNHEIPNHAVRHNQSFNQYAKRRLPIKYMPSIFNDSGDLSKLS